LESKGITCVELSTLLGILDGKEWQDEFLDLFPPVGDGSSGLTRVADQLLSRLTDFDYDADKVAADWAGTEEMQWEAEDARSLLGDLAQHAVRAKQVGKPVYLWNCV
jgi:hypothetical protein